MPAVALVFASVNAVSRQGELLARYLTGCWAVDGQNVCSHVYLVDLSPKCVSNTSWSVISRKNTTFESKMHTGKRYTETSDAKVLQQCEFIIYCVDGDRVDLNQVLPPSIPVLVLQYGVKNINAVANQLRKNIVIHGTACFYIIGDGILTSCTNGAIATERLSREKASAAVWLDRIEHIGVPVVCRKTITAIKWGFSSVSLVYYLSALTDQTPFEILEDRPMRLVLAQLFYEIQQVVAKATQYQDWTPDTTGTDTFLSFQLIQSILPWPNVFFRVLNVYERMKSPLESADAKTLFPIEFDDLFDLAQRCRVDIPAFQILREEFQNTTPRIDTWRLYSRIKPSAASRKPATYFLLRILGTLVVSGLLGFYF